MTAAIDAVRSVDKRAKNLTLSKRVGQTHLVSFPATLYADVDSFFGETDRGMRLSHGFIALTTFSVLTACGHGANGVILDAASRASTTQGASPRSTSVPSYNAVKLPSGFVPWAIMPNGEIPGTIAHHAAIYNNSQLTALPDFPGCGNAQKEATGANDRGEVVGFCNARRNGIIYGIPLYYLNGTVKRLSIASKNTIGVDVKINDTGEIVGNFDYQGLESSELFQLYSDGSPAKSIGDAGGFWPISLNDNGDIAVTQFFPGLCCQAGSASLAGNEQIITGPCSQVFWISSDNTIVGVAGCKPYVGFEYQNGALTYLPGPMIQPTGINSSDTIIGNGSSGIILGDTDISGDISPVGDYKIKTPGLSDNGAFVAVSAGVYYQVAPMSNMRFTSH